MSTARSLLDLPARALADPGWDSRKDHPYLYDLLEAFERVSGVPTEVSNRLLRETDGTVRDALSRNGIRPPDELDEFVSLALANVRQTLETIVAQWQEGLDKATARRDAWDAISRGELDAG